MTSDFWIVTAHIEMAHVTSSRNWFCTQEKSVRFRPRLHKKVNTKNFKIIVWCIYYLCIYLYNKLLDAWSEAERSKAAEEKFNIPV